MQGVCVKCGEICAVVLKGQRAVSDCCAADALEDGVPRIITAAELTQAASAAPKRRK